MAAAQIVHAAGESVKSPLPKGTHAIVLAVPNEAQLVRISESLTHAHIEHVLIEESDPPFTGERTAIGIRPVRDRSAVKRVLSSLPLLGRPSGPQERKLAPAPSPDGEVVSHEE